MQLSPICKIFVVQMALAHVDVRQKLRNVLVLSQASTIEARRPIQLSPKSTTAL